MRLILTLDNLPTLASAKELRERMNNMRINKMEFCRVYGFIDRYNQFQAWLSGRKSNQKMYKKFLKALITEGVITDYEKEHIFRK